MATVTGRAAPAPCPLVGRFTELSLAKSLLREGKRGRPSILMIGGEDGVGKTRLVGEIASLARSMGFLVVEARIRRDDPNVLAGLTQIVEGLTEALGEGEIRRALGGLPPALCTFLPALLAFRDSRASDPGALPDPDAERLRLYQATRVFFTRLLEDRPTVWICDDLHNARDGELKLFGFLARTLSSWDDEKKAAPSIVSVATHRLPLPEGALEKLLDSAERQGYPFETIRLPPLSERDAFELARGSAKGFPESLRGDLFRKTGGNPFFVMEALKEARVKGGKIRTLPELPAEVVDLVRARLSRFDERARTVSFAAAALGEGFTLDLLRAVVGMPLGELLTTVGKLVEENVLERDHVDRTFRFTHSFVKEAIYESSPALLRQKAHRAAARALEAEMGHTGRFARLAYHYGHSGERDREIRSLQRAGEEALARYDAREARVCYERLIASYEALDEASQTSLRDLHAKGLSGLVKSCRMLGETARAVPAARELLGVAKKEQDPVLVATALRDLAEVLSDANETSSALAHLDEAIRVAREAGDRAGLARAVAAKSTLIQRLGDPNALPLIRECIALAEEVDDDETLAESLVREAIYLFERGDDRAAERSYTRALRIAKARRVPRLAALARTARGAVLAHRGEYENALREFSASLAINKRIGDVRSVGHSFGNMASMHAVIGRWDKAVDLHRKAIVILKGLGFRGDLAYSLFSIGNIEVDRRRYRQALDAYGEALAIRKELGERNRIAELMNNIGITYFEMGDYQKAREHLEVAMGLALEMNYVLLGVETNLYLGAVTAVTGDPDGGLAMIRRAREDAGLHNLPAQVCTAQYLQGFVMAGQGRAEEGIAEIGKAIEKARSLGLKPYVDRFERTIRDIQEGRGASPSS